MSVEKVPVRSVGKPQACMKVNDDNPMSSNHPGTLTLNTQWNVEKTYPYLPTGKGGTGAKLSSATIQVAQHKQIG